MNTVLLGKTVKAMYKLSGKSIEKLSDETELSIDTINNFFYARLQKPSFIGVCKLVNATGNSMTDLMAFMDIAESLPGDANITDEFAKYLLSVNETGASVNSTKPSVPAADETAGPAGQKAAYVEGHGFNEIKEVYQTELDKLHKIIKLLVFVIVLLVAIIVVITIMALVKM